MDTTLIEHTASHQAGGEVTPPSPPSRPSRDTLPDRPRLVTIKDRETLLKLIEAAKADDHIVVEPTHVMMKGEQIIGYLSLGGLPVVQSWFDSKSGHVFDSLKMIEMGEAIYDSQGVKAYCVAVSDKSPFAPFMTRLGFTPMMTTTLWHKRLG